MSFRFSIGTDDGHISGIDVAESPFVEAQGVGNRLTRGRFGSAHSRSRMTVDSPFLAAHRRCASSKVIKFRPASTSKSPSSIAARHSAASRSGSVSGSRPARRTSTNRDSPSRCRAASASAIAATAKRSRSASGSTDANRLANSSGRSRVRVKVRLSFRASRRFPPPRSEQVQKKARVPQLYTTF